MKRLTVKQETFCQQYLIDLNASRAAIRTGYSANTANIKGHQLLNKPAIAERVKALIDERSERTAITADKVLNELAAIGFANVKDFVTVVEKERPGKKGVVHKYKAVEINQTGDIEAEKMKAVAGIRNTKDGIVVMMHDKVKALELIAKHLQMFKDEGSNNLSQYNITLTL